MSLIYVVIARQSTFLAEYTSSQGNFQNVTKQVIDKFSENQKQTFEYSGYMFHCLSDQGLNFVCMCDL